MRKLSRASGVAILIALLLGVSGTTGHAALLCNVSVTRTVAYSCHPDILNLCTTVTATITVNSPVYTMSVGQFDWSGIQGGGQWNDIPGGGWQVSIERIEHLQDIYVSGSFSGENDLGQTCSVSGNSVYMN